MEILDDMGVSELSAKVFFEKWTTPLIGYCVVEISPSGWEKEIVKIALANHFTMNIMGIVSS